MRLQDVRKVITARAVSILYRVSNQSSNDQNPSLIGFISIIPNKSLTRVFYSINTKVLLVLLAANRLEDDKSIMDHVAFIFLTIVKSE